MTCRFQIILLLTLIFTGSVFPFTVSADTDTDEVILVHIEIPVDEDKAKNKLVAGSTWERATITITNTGNSTLSNVTSVIEAPEYLTINIPTQPVSIEQTDQISTALIGDLKPHDTVTIIMDVKPPVSIEYKKNVDIKIITTFDTGKNIYTHPISIIPPPSMASYLIIVLSFLIFFGIMIIGKRFGVLELFTTVDLITIALIAAIIAVVLRYLSKMINLGWFDGLVIAIPTVILMIAALRLVRKPGTATLLFTVVLLISMIIWGSHIMWLGFYLAEGVIVDLLVVIFKMDYADRRSTAIIYGVVRGVTVTLLFYLLFAPIEWKICYDMWYIYMQVAIACVGGFIGGYLGYDTANKMAGAKL